MSVAREAKHRAFVVQRRAKRTAKKFKFDTATVLFEHRQRRRPFVYRPSRYRDTFLARDVPARGASAFPARVFAVWTGDNEMSVNRKRSLAVIADRIELPLELVTPAQRRLIDQLEVGRDVSPRIRIAFEVTDVDAASSRMIVAGAEPIAPPIETPWRSLNARFDGPGPIHLTLFQELDGTPS